MNVENLATLPRSVACALVREVNIEALALTAIGVQVMGMGAEAIAHTAENHPSAVASHLVVVAAIAGPLHIIVLAMILHMLIEIRVAAPPCSYAMFFS
ncbi:hypothetical protein SLA2020_237840 [Shorea laevis]